MAADGPIEVRITLFFVMSHSGPRGSALGNCSEGRQLESNSWKAFKGFFSAMKNQLEKFPLLLEDANGRVADLRSISKSVTKAVIGYCVYKNIH